MCVFHEYFDDDEPIHLVLDLYPSHMTDQVRQYAAALGIIFHIIPAGMTDYYQPLDRKIFGILKAKARKFFRKRNSGETTLKATKIEACTDMIAAWEGITRAAVGSEWEIYTDEDAFCPTEEERKRKEQLMSYHRDFVENLRKEKRSARVESNFRDSMGYKDITLN